MCAACSLPTPRRLCYFCSRTVELIKARRCVSCTEPVRDEDFPNGIQGKCVACLSRNQRVSAGTRWLLAKASNARYRGGRMQVASSPG